MEKSLGKLAVNLIVSGHVQGIEVDMMVKPELATGFLLTQGSKSATFYSVKVSDDGEIFSCTCKAIESIAYEPEHVN